MKCWLLVSLVAVFCSHLPVGKSQNTNCDLSGGKFDATFPNIESEGIESYQMKVEYTAKSGQQTDFYTEYYDILFRQGRVDSHQAGKSFSYIYKTASLESWTVKGRNCVLTNLTILPNLLKDDQTNWRYIPEDRTDKWTIGPSAMFKIAYDLSVNGVKGKMAYMGKSKERIRGLDAVLWRRCLDDGSPVDYYFTTDDEENEFGMAKLKKIPLRVVFGNSESDDLSAQVYDIISFQPFISAEKHPFQLPKGRNCRRGPLVDTPDIPDFTNKNLLFSAEVIYRVIDRNTEEETKVWSYYSTLMMALDVSTQHLAYYYTPWNTTKPKNDNEEPFVNSPEYVIYDMRHEYAYKTTVDTGECTIIREKSFQPYFYLPDGSGGIALTDPSILFPNNELSYISEGTDRGLEVNIFEGISEGYLLDKEGKKISIPKAIITHAYLKDNVIEDNTVSVQNAPTQVQLRFTGRIEKAVEILTFNFFGFTTQITGRRSIFNILRCFKNEDDYLWVTIGFNADKDVLVQARKDVPSIQSNILNLIELKSELNAVRIPIIQVDVKDAVYVTMLILGKPPIILDYLEPEEGKSVLNTPEVQGLSTLESCANACLETEDNCWAFSICGEDTVGVCYFAATTGATVGPKEKCKLYRRYNNKTFVQSKELAAQSIRQEVENREVKLMLPGKDGAMIQIDASSIFVTAPGEDDSLFEIMGNELNPRMRVKKAGAKLKDNAGTYVKNLGKVRYDECQRLCLDYKECETVSYCLKDYGCLLSKKYGEDIKDSEIEENTMCNLLTRKYADHFVRSPGIVMSATATAVLDKPTVEECARACLTETKFKCLSFDHCPSEDKKACMLHTVHYSNPKDREAVKVNKPSCGHYYRKFSTEFKKNPEKRYQGTKVPPLTNVTLEDCAKSCEEYGKGTCFGFDFCQDVTIYATTCTLIDKDPSTLKSSYSAVCTNFLRTEQQFAPRPYSTSYAAGIGFLCFLVGGVVGIAVVFTIAYIKVNRR